MPRTTTQCSSRTIPDDELSGTEWAVIAKKKELEFKAAKPYIKDTKLAYARRGKLSEADLRDEVRHVITNILTDEEREELETKIAFAVKKIRDDE